MKLKITMLKGPWPQGAKVGDVIDLPRLPSWALGKCVQVDDETEATIAFPEGGQVAEHPDLARVKEEAKQAIDHAAATVAQLKDDHAGVIRQLKADHDAVVADLKAKIAQAEAGAGGRLQELIDANAKLTADLAEAKAALAKGHKGGK